MEDIQKKTLDEEGLCDLILCDPFTDEGSSALSRLGIQDQITEQYFLDHVWVDSQYAEKSEYPQPKEELDADVLNGQYTVSFAMFQALKKRRKEFNQRFTNDDRHSNTLIILGVVGNGKTISIRKRIAESVKSFQPVSLNSIYLDLGHGITEVTYETEYACPNSEKALWLFCTKLLDGVMDYIQFCYPYTKTIWSNFESKISRKYIANKQQKKVFECIKNYGNGTCKISQVFLAVISLLNSKNAEDDIQSLLKLLLLLMYCATPEEKHYIVFDNIEEYIHLDSLMIQVPNSDISKIYSSVRTAMENIANSLDRIGKNIAWKKFKILIGLRRTSLSQLNPRTLPDNEERKNVHDVTGYIQVKDIWKSKKTKIWDGLLRDRYDSDSQYLVNLADYIMVGGDGGTGTEYQLLIAALMSHGIRRNAHAQAKAIYSTYSILSDSSSGTINREIFDMLKEESLACRYMLRRALIEMQLKRSISPEENSRWGRMNIGHLAKKEVNVMIGQKKIKIHKILYHDSSCITLLRRVLTSLSVQHDAQAAEGDGVSMVDMYNTLSLYEVIKRVYTNPVGNISVEKKDYLQLANVLLSICNMSLRDTKGSPFAILFINDQAFHAQPNEESLALLLKEIYNAGPSQSMPGKRFNADAYGIRIVEAGVSFLLDWLSSYSFMAALYCFDIPPLFFLRDKDLICYVLQTVYAEANSVCEMYENEAARFCPPHCSLCRDNYLPKHGEEYISFRKRTRILHTSHLDLYRQFINNYYKILRVSDKDKSEILDCIEYYRKLYLSWEHTKENNKCF